MLEKGAHLQFLDLIGLHRPIKIPEPTGAKKTYEELESLRDDMFLSTVLASSTA